MRLTHSQMLAHWRRAHGYEDSRLDCSAELSEGIDITQRLVMDMRAWYLQLLDTAESRFLTVTDETSRFRAETSRSGVWQSTLPADVRRIIAVKTGDIWLNAPDAEGVKASLANRYDSRPAWIVNDARTLTVTAPGAQTPQIQAIMCVTDPGDEYYDLDESALALIGNLKFKV